MVSVVAGVHNGVAIRRHLVGLMIIWAEPLQCRRGRPDSLQFKETSRFADACDERRIGLSVAVVGREPTFRSCTIFHPSSENERKPSYVPWSDHCGVLYGIVIHPRCSALWLELGVRVR